MIYIICNNAIYNYDPTLPVSDSNPTINKIALPDNSCKDLAVSNNLNAESPSPTFYTIKDGKYYYYDGKNWINTEHKAHSTWGIGGGGKFIYSLHKERYVYKYDGKKEEIFLLEIPKTGITGDIVGDCAGNFYLFNPRIREKDDLVDSDIYQWLREYDSSGKLLHIWTVNGLPAGYGAGTLGIIGNSVYLRNSTGDWKGIMNDSSINFTAGALNEIRYRIFSSNLDFFDYGTCPLDNCFSPDSAIGNRLELNYHRLEDRWVWFHLKVTKVLTLN